MNFVNNIRMKRKLFFSYLIIVLIPICIIGYFLTSALYKSSFSNVTNFSYSTFRQIQGNYLSKLAMYKDIANTITDDPSMRKYIDTYYTQDYEAYNDFITGIAPLLNRASYNDRDVNIKIYSANDTIDFSYVTSNQISELDGEKWFRKPEESTSNVTWTHIEGERNKDIANYIGCYRMLMDNYKLNKLKAVVSIFFNEEQLYLLVSEEKKAGKIVFLYDDQGNIVSTTERDLLFGSIDKLDFSADKSSMQHNGGDLLDYKGKKFLIFSSVINQSDININNWHLIYMVPAGKILSDINKIWITSLALCILCFIFTLIIILILSQNITKRISNLINKINRVWTGDFKIGKEISGKDEIGELEVDFYRMVEKTDTLINEVYQAEINYQKVQRQKNEAELIALHRQINPHYLFNTLETIRMKLVKKNDRETANIIMVFAESFRACMERQNELYTIIEELELVRKYFIIQKYRYGDKINLEINIPEELHGYLIPKLILQPLIENAVYHGLETKLGGGRIKIDSHETDGILNISVSDNGIGIDEGMLGRIKERIYGNIPIDAKTKTPGLALKNVHSRISLLYGNNYGLKIFSEKDKGTIVEINLPVQKANETNEI